MAFRPITSNPSGPSAPRKVAIAERSTRTGAAPTTSSSSSFQSRHGAPFSGGTSRAGHPSATTSVASAASAAAAAAKAAAAEEEAAKQFTLQVELDAAMRELANSQHRSEALRRRLHAQASSQARLIADNEEWMAQREGDRARCRAAYAAELEAAEAERTAAEGEQRGAEEAAAAAAALCSEALAARAEAAEQLRLMAESVENRRARIAQEGTKQDDIKASLAVVEAEIAELERKKRIQIEKMDELKAKVEQTRLLEAGALADLEARKQVLVTLQRNIDALRKIRKGAH